MKFRFPVFIIAARTTQHVPIDDLEGRFATSSVTLYPPGIWLSIHGEMFNKKIVEHLKFNRTLACKCQKFETDIHGHVQELDENNQVRYFVDCVTVE